LDPEARLIFYSGANKAGTSGGAVVERDAAARGRNVIAIHDGGGPAVGWGVLLSSLADRAPIRAEVGGDLPGAFQRPLFAQSFSSTDDLAALMTLLERQRKENAMGALAFAFEAIGPSRSQTVPPAVNVSVSGWTQVSESDPLWSAPLWGLRYGVEMRAIRYTKYFDSPQGTSLEQTKEWAFGGLGEFGGALRLWLSEGMRLSLEAGGEFGYSSEGWLGGLPFRARLLFGRSRYRFGLQVGIAPAWEPAAHLRYTGVGAEATTETTFGVQFRAGVSYEF